jgi:hypothetical protein
MTTPGAGAPRGSLFWYWLWLVLAAAGWFAFLLAWLDPGVGVPPQLTAVGWAVLTAGYAGLHLYRCPRCRGRFAPWNRHFGTVGRCHNCGYPDCGSGASDDRRTVDGVR